MNTSHITNGSEISVIIDLRIYGYLFAPIIERLDARGVKTYIYTPRQLKNSVKQDLGERNNVEFLDLDPIRKNNRWRWFMHRIARDVFLRDDFSFQMYKERNEKTAQLPTVRRMLIKFSQFLPKVQNKSINSFLEQLVGLGMKNPFRTTTIMAGSLNASAELLCAKNQFVITVMESWDHAVKRPNGYRSELVFVWNDDLKRDWQRVHNDPCVHVFYPLKLRYARDVVSQWAKSRRTNFRPFFVYSVSSTRRFSISILTEIEKRLIRDMAQAAEVAGWDMFIKPRPNGENGEFLSVIEEFSHVRIGSIVDQDVGIAANYFLSDEYNKIRFSEIEGAEFIVNAFTTFGLDAAAAGIPVLQIDVRNADGYDDSKLIYENYHLKTYLLSRNPVLRINGNFQSEFTDFLKSPNSMTEHYSAELREWLFSDRDQEVEINNLVDKIAARAFRQNEIHKNSTTFNSMK